MNIGNYICPICRDNPYSHSLKYLGTFHNSAFLYTRPADAIRYDDRPGILAHYNGVFRTLINDHISSNTNSIIHDDEHITCHRWSWLFDARGFSWQHYLEMGLAIDLAKLINTPIYSNSLDNIYIFRPPALLHMTLSIVYPFLSTRLREKIIIINRIPSSISRHIT